MGGKNKVGIIFCGGCNCYFDRAELYQELVSKLRNMCDFYGYDIDSNEAYDLVVLINGCPSECLVGIADKTKLLLINNKNYHEACRLIEQELEEIDHGCDL